MKPTPRTSIRDIEMISPLLWKKLGIRVRRDEIAELRCRPLEFASSGVDDGFDFLFR
jgi:hypothetical protein